MGKWIMAAVGGVLAVGVANARAGVSVDIDVHSGPPARAWSPATERVWVPPVTETVTQTVWHEPVTEDRVDRVWMPDRYDVRDVATTDQWGRPVTIRQSVLVEPAHWQETRTPVVVRAGYYGPEASVVTVRPGYWQTVPVYGPPAYRDPCGPAVVIAPPYRDRPFYRDDFRRDDGRHGYDHDDRYHDHR